MTPGKAKLTVSWGSASGADGYNVYRSVTGASGSFGLTRGQLTSTTFDDTFVNNGGTYYYYVVAYNNAGGSPNSSTVTATLILTAPSPTARAGKAQIVLSWSAISEADNYYVFRSATGMSGSFNYRSTVTTNSYLDTGVWNGQTFYYYVVAGNAAGGSDNSGVAACAVNLGPPSGLRAVLNNGQVSVSWGALADADSYSVYRSVFLNLNYFNYIGTTTSSTYLDTNANTGWPVYYYYVIPNNQASVGQRSAIVSTDGRMFPCPPHASCVAPLDRSNGGADGPSKPDPVNLATGTETYAHAPDLVVDNQTGPPVSWQRQYLSYQALNGYASPGLSAGWVHTYDISVQGPATAGTWGALTLRYYNGAVESLTPVLDGSGPPTGALTTQAGVPYFAQGVAGASAGVWQSVTITWKEQTQWRFTPLAAATYALTRIVGRTGQSIDLTWDGNRADTSQRHKFERQPAQSGL